MSPTVPLQSLGQSLRRVLRPLRPWADLLGVLGALILFFSWAWTTGVEEERAEALASLRAAEQNRLRAGEVIVLAQGSHLLMRHLAEVERSIHHAIRTHSLRSDDKVVPSDREMDEWQDFIEDRQRFSLVMLMFRSQQVDMLVRLCRPLTDQSRAAGGESDAGSEIHRTCEAIQALQDEKDQIFAQARSVLEGHERQAVTDEAVLKQRAMIEPGFLDIQERLHPLMTDLTQALEVRLEEIAVVTAAAERAALVAKTVSLWLYGVGTVLVLLRTILIDAVPGPPVTSPARPAAGRQGLPFRRGRQARGR